MRQISLSLGRFRLRVIRLWKGGPCPMTVLSDDWTLVPTQHKPEHCNSEPLSLSPGRVFKTLLSKTLKLLHKRGFHGQLL
jgi:hypothetical protein